jgi:hypothetical protein
MFSSFDTLEPNDVAVIRAVLEDVCREKGLAYEGPKLECSHVSLPIGISSGFIIQNS